MDAPQLLAQFDEQGITSIQFAFADIDGVLRGKVISLDKFRAGLADGYGFCDVVFGWDVADAAYDNAALTGWHTGYPDRPVRIDLSTFREKPWAGGKPFFLADFSSGNGPENDLQACPRSLMKRVAQQAEEMGYRAEMAQEFEFFVFQETPHTLQEKDFRDLTPLTPGMFGYSMLRPALAQSFTDDLFNWLTQFGIPIEGLHTETGPGVYEAAIHHDTALRAADKAILFKTSVKEIAYKHGLMASFMAKWNADLPGCSGHIHQSLWTPTDTTDDVKNLFFAPTQPGNMSTLARQYIAGQLHCLPHILPMYAPTVNSYKRLVEGAWAPTTLTWGFDNRTVAMRVLNQSDAYTRVEMRVPGADTNPYLAMSAALASGLYGIRHGLSLDVPPTTGNGYENAANGRIAPNLRAATDLMRDSPIAAELFGAGFVNHFCQTRDWEHRQYARQVSDWELKRYFEII